MTQIHICDTGWKLYNDWSTLLDQRKPKAGRREITAAKNAYVDHRMKCPNCTPFRG